MIAAPAPRADRERERLLVVGPRGVRADAVVGELPGFLGRGDLLVVNDAATLPASLPAWTSEGAPVELRLASHQGGGRFLAVLFGAGSWRTPTEHRPPPPALAPGCALDLGGARAVVKSVSYLSPRLVEIEIEGDPWDAIYARGRPVQYAHAAAALHLWDVQTAYAARPWAVELPSAGRPLTWNVLLALRRRGVEIRALTHAAGLSSTGDPAIDAALPLPERFEIPAATAAAVSRARNAGRRIVAVGTSVVRALEGAAALNRESGVTSLRIGPDHRLAVVTALLTGIHVAGTSHHELLRAFLPAAALDAALRRAEESGYLAHEFGDSMLVLGSQ